MTDLAIIAIAVVALAVVFRWLDIAQARKAALPKGRRRRESHWSNIR